MTMPNPVAEVVERLREHAEYCRQLDSGSGDAKVFDAAANEIESLRIEVHAIKYEVMGGEDVPGSANAATVDDVRNEIARLVGQNRDAQAEIERLSRERDTGVPEGFVVALRKISALAEQFDDERDQPHLVVGKLGSIATLALAAAPQPPTVSTQGWPEGASSDLPDEIYVERDAETNEKRWFSCKGMGEKYVHARLLDNWKFVAKYGLAKVTPEHTWAQWLAEMKADLSALARERDQAREALANLRLTARVLLQNAEGCAANHYGADFEQHGPPGWLADCENAIKSAETVIAGSMQEVTHDT